MQLPRPALTGWQMRSRCSSRQPPRLPSFGPSAGASRPTTPSADFCAAVGSPRGAPSPKYRTRHRSPRLSLTTFVARPPDLQHWTSMDGGLCRLWSARPTSTAYYPIPVRQPATLLHASFRQRLTTPPLRFANPSPPSSWTRDSHPQLVKHAWQTKKTSASGLDSRWPRWRNPILPSTGTRHPLGTRARSASCPNR